MTKRGYPDWGDNEGSITIPSHDNNESAARLGALSRFERSGITVFYDDGNQYLYPYSVITPSNTSVYRQVYRGSISGSDIVLRQSSGWLSSPSVALYLPYSRLSKIGVEFLFRATCETPGTWPLLDFDTIIYNRGNAWQFQHFADLNLTKWKINAYKNGLFGTYTIFTNNDSGYYYFAAGSYNHVKYILDPENNRYQSLVVNGNYFDLTGYSVSRSTGAYNNRMGFTFDTSSAVGNYTMYLSDLIITIDEIYRRE